jgi:hypothetical protein
MRVIESKFEDHLKNMDKVDLHKYNKITDINNLIIYGPKGIGKYSQALKIIQNYSDSNLKYERKFFFQHNKEEYSLPLSDVHTEVDFAMLGCISKSLWHEIYKNYVDIILSKPNKSGIILCKNFDEIHIELYEIFSSYIDLFNEPYDIKFIIITENISFINNNILNKCDILNLSKSSKSLYQTCIKENNKNKNILHNTFLHNYDVDCHIKICNKIICYVLDIQKFDINEFRELLYELLIYNLKISSCIWYIIKVIFYEHKQYNVHLTDVLQKSIMFFHYYNNNYRPIYHLENFFMYIINKIHEF